MKVILTKAVPKIGKKNEIIEVKSGYALNYLFPNKLAIPATKHAIKQAETSQAKQILKAEEIKENASDVKSKINNKTYTISEKVTDKGHLYGSITEKEIVELLKKEEKIELDKLSIHMEHIKELGDHRVTIKLANKTEAIVNIRVEEKKEVK